MRQDEPGRGLADGLLGDGARIEGGRAEVIQDDRCGPPEGDERQHRRRRHHDFWERWHCRSRDRLFSWIATHVFVNDVFLPWNLPCNDRWA